MITLMTFFLPWNTKGDILSRMSKLHFERVNGDHGFQARFSRQDFKLTPN